MTMNMLPNSLRVKATTVAAGDRVHHINHLGERFWFSVVSVDIHGDVTITCNGAYLVVGPNDEVNVHNNGTSSEEVPLAN